MHNAAGLAFVLPIDAAVLIWTAVSEPTFRTRAHWFRWYSLATFVVAVALPLLMMRFGNGSANVGLMQRASFSVLNLWLLVFALVAWSRLTSARVRDDGAALRA